MLAKLTRQLTWISCIMIFATLAGCAFFVKEQTLPPKNLRSVKVDSNHALQLVNNWRSKHKLPPVKLDTHLTIVSQEMATHIAKRDSLATPLHSSSSLQKRTQTPTYRSKAGAENLGAGYKTLEDAFIGWKNSKDHNKNLLNPYVTHMGIALTVRDNGRYRYFWVMTLAAPYQSPTREIRIRRPGP
ncbi:CAP domain-containing protein [Polycladidibacter stylochi]|uniref:CAP domain-containing protein n=1 Tax=Polycladidibacter stylochi TaxID=1807766 RepID=UPI00082E8F83|nr:CAP domain-containing protein [Pseudovibrio stylochi]